QGIASMWTRMGDGNMGMQDYLRTYIAKCPGRAVSLEVIVSQTPRLFNYRDPNAWEPYRKTPAWEFTRFFALAEKGSPPAGWQPPPPAPVEAAPRAQGAGPGRGAPHPAGGAPALADAEASIKWTKEFLGRM